MKWKRDLLIIFNVVLLIFSIPNHALGEEVNAINKDLIIALDDFLHTDGNQIKNSKGEIIQLKGCNLGGWLHLEGWMDGGCNYVDYDVRTILISRFGEDKADELLDSYQDANITEEDFEYLSSLGVNFVRIPFYWMEIRL